MSSLVSTSLTPTSGPYAPPSLGIATSTQHLPYSTYGPTLISCSRQPTMSSGTQLRWLDVYRSSCRQPTASPGTHCLTPSDPPDPCANCHVLMCSGVVCTLEPLSRRDWVRKVPALWRHWGPVSGAGLQLVTCQCGWRLLYDIVCGCLADAARGVSVTCCCCW